MYEGLKETCDIIENEYLIKYFIFDEDKHTVWIVWDVKEKYK